MWAMGALLADLVPPPKWMEGLQLQHLNRHDLGGDGLVPLADATPPMPGQAVGSVTRVRAPQGRVHAVLCGSYSPYRGKDAQY